MAATLHEERRGDALPAPTGGHRAGTVLDAEPHRPETPLPRGWQGLLLFAALTALYAAVGYRVTIGSHVVVFDALDRLTRAYLVWHNDPPKLAAVGFVFPPLTTFSFLPFAVVKPLATSLVALPLMSATFAAGTVVVLDRTLARCDLRPLLRYPLLAAFALNPFWLFYAGNGMSEAVYAFFLAFTLYSFISWYATTEPRFLIGAGFALSVLVMTRYAFLVWAVLFAVLIGVALVRRQASAIEVEGSVIAFAAPIAYVLALWVLFNALIVGEPLGWLTEATTSTQAVNSTGVAGQGDLDADEVSRRLLQIIVAVFPLALLVVPVLLASFLTERNDMALWLASFLVLGIAIMGVHALASDRADLLTLRDAMPMSVAAFVGAAWAFRSLQSVRLPVFLATLAVLVAGVLTAWHGMRTYPFQSLEQAFTRAVLTGEDQEGRPSLGGYTVGISSEARMADVLKEEVPPKRRSILTDNARTFGVLLLHGRPGDVFDRIDEGDARFRQVLEDPHGVVDYLLLSVGGPSADAIRRRYPLLEQGGEPGMEVVVRTPRYLLARVAPRDPSVPTPSAPAP